MSVDDQQWVSLSTSSGCCSTSILLGQATLSYLSVDGQQRYTDSIRSVQQRKNIEGTLFLIKRQAHPRFQMLVLNKLSTGGSLCKACLAHRTSSIIKLLIGSSTHKEPEGTSPEQVASLCSWHNIHCTTCLEAYAVETMTHCAGICADNYIETVHGGLEMETNPPYLMYTHGNDEVR
eukprot:GHRR01029886.1.p1 GENE.GHRR01029886.1~~GHRR01029886.1.p1  ORF type:complete len:177 (-),score=32.74 GHRR01029886.1:261-791(-)